MANDYTTILQLLNRDSFVQATNQFWTPPFTQ